VRQGRCSRQTAIRPMDEAVNTRSNERIDVQPVPRERARTAAAGRRGGNSSMRRLRFGRAAAVNFVSRGANDGRRPSDGRDARRYERPVRTTSTAADANVVAWFAAQERIHVSVVTLEELAFGIARTSPSARSRLVRWLDAFVDARPIVLDVTAAIARASGDLRAAREARGRRVAQADMLIAATALAHGLTLVTRNRRDFERCGVAVVDPFG
jgi:toxin FitB